MTQFPLWLAFLSGWPSNKRIWQKKSSCCSWKRKKPLGWHCLRENLSLTFFANCLNLHCWALIGPFGLPAPVWTSSRKWPKGSPLLRVACNSAELQRCWPKWTAEPRRIEWQSSVVAQIVPPYSKQASGCIESTRCAFLYALFVRELTFSHLSLLCTKLNSALLRTVVQVAMKLMDSDN